MTYKKLLFIFLISFPLTNLFANNPDLTFKFYGFVRSNLYYNTRQNVEAIDGLFNLFPKPKEEVLGIDNNATPSSEMLSVATRLGVDITGAPIFGAKTSAKVECDFAGISTSYYLIRLRQAYFKLNWKNNELLIGQTWHPMFSNCVPLVPSLSAGAPFQPFNRSPQIRFKQNLNETFSFLATASYQMQYTSQGPLNSSSSYLKNGLLPSLHIGLDFKSGNFNTGIGVDGKSLLVNHSRVNSGAAVAYAQYNKDKFHILAKSVYGQNLSEFLMIGGYGVNGIKKINDDLVVNTYTNFNTSTSWLSLAYGNKIQTAIFGGFSKNLGTNEALLATNGIYTAYGYGYYQGSQTLLDQLYRVAPSITWNFQNLRLSLEYELTSAKYGTIKSDGLISDPYTINNHRGLATVSYFF